jgi:TolB-like protein
VIRALLGWGIASFAVLQIYEPLMHGLHLPEWTLSFVVVALGLGFPVTVGLAWVFDLGPRGIERTPSASSPERADPARPSRARLAVLLLGVGLCAAAPGLVYFFVWPGGAHREGVTASPAPQSPPSVAVLPFADLSAQKDQEYLADGIAEEILNALAHVGGLRVPGRTSSFWFKDKGVKLADMGRELGVRNVLQGSVRKDGNRVRITAQLLDVGNGYQLWSQTFDRDLTDIFRIQDEIAGAVASALEVKLLSPASGKATARPPRIEAYEQYLLGRQLLNAGTTASIQGAREAFLRAVALDDTYAAAHAGLAQAHGAVAGYVAETPDEVTEAATLELASAERAIALDPELPDGYVARASHRLSYAWNWKGGLADIERARSLGTGEVGLNNVHARALTAVGRFADGLASARRATEIDPLSVGAWTILSRMLLDSGDHSGALVAARRGLQISPDNPSPAFLLGCALLEEGKLDEALDVFDRNSFTFFRLTGLAITHHAMGHARESQAALDELVSKLSMNAAFQIAQVHAARGEADAAFEWLERARVQHDEGLEYVRMDKLFASLYPDPRWKAFLKRMNLPVE